MIALHRTTSAPAAIELMPISDEKAIANRKFTELLHAVSRLNRIRGKTIDLCRLAEGVKAAHDQLPQKPNLSANWVTPHQRLRWQVTTDCKRMELLETWANLAERIRWSLRPLAQAEREVRNAEKALLELGYDIRHIRHRSASV
jgi:hypothetical protein